MTTTARRSSAWQVKGQSKHHKLPQRQQMKQQRVQANLSNKDSVPRKEKVITVLRLLLQQVPTPGHPSLDRAKGHWCISECKPIRLAQSPTGARALPCQPGCYSLMIGIDHSKQMHKRPQSRVAG